VYEKEAVGPSIPGFLKKWSANPTEAVYLEYEEYRSVMSKWHKNLTTAFKNCLESRDYMHVRNALAVLEKIIGQYPQVDFHGNSLEEKVNVIAAKTETRGDLQVRAQGYLALLRKSSKSWVTATKFSTQSKPSGSPADSPNPNRPMTPQATLSPSVATGEREIVRNKSNLNPSAPSFKPTDEESKYFHCIGTEANIFTGNLKIAAPTGQVHPHQLEILKDLLPAKRARDALTALGPPMKHLSRSRPASLRPQGVNRHRRMQLGDRAEPPKFRSMIEGKWTVQDKTSHLVNEMNQQYQTIDH
jgi:hypothetical protein